MTSGRRLLNFTGGCRCARGAPEGEEGVVRGVDGAVNFRFSKINTSTRRPAVAYTWTWHCRYITGLDIRARTMFLSLPIYSPLASPRHRRQRFPFLRYHPLSLSYGRFSRGDRPPTGSGHLSSCLLCENIHTQRLVLHKSVDKSAPLRPSSVRPAQRDLRDSVVSTQKIYNLFNVIMSIFPTRRLITSI